MADVKIDIPGIGEVVAENAASESTLRDLLKAMGSGTGPDTNKTQKNIDDLGDTSKDASKDVEGFGSALSKATSGLVNGLLGAIGTAVGSVTGLATELLAGGNQLSSFTQYLPIPGLTQLSGLIDGQVDVFRDLSQTGATFGNNMFEITRIAGRAAIPQQDFIELLTQQSDSIRLFGNSVGDGARNFAGLSKELRQSTAGRDLMAMGFTTQELNESLVDYNEMMVVSGRRRFMSDQQLAEGAAEYSKELDAISKLTGKSRKQLAEELKQKNLDIRRQMAINKLGEEFGLRLQQASAASPALEAALLDMADGVANDPLTQQLMANNATFREQARNVQNMTAEQMNNFIASMAKDGMAFADTLGEAGVQASIAGGTATGEYLNMVGQLQKIQETEEGTINSEQQARDKATTAMATMAETINDIRGTIQADILDSPIFKFLSDKFGEMVPTLDEAKGMFQTFKDEMMPILNDLTSDFLKYVPQIREFFGKLFSPEGREELYNDFKEKLTTWFSSWWDGLTTEDLMAGVAAGLAAVLLGPLGLIGGAIVAGITATFGWENIKTFFEEQTAKFAPYALEIWEDIKSWFGSLFTFDSLDLDVTGMITDAWNNIKSWFADLFTFDISFPNFSDYLPKWLGGKGLDWNIFGDSDNPAPKPEDTLPPEPDGAEGAKLNTTPSIESQFAGTDSGTQLAMLNTTASEMRDLIRRQNSLLKQLDGNLQG